MFLTPVASLYHIKGIQHAQFGTSDCTVYKLLRSKRQPIQRTGQLNRNPTSLQTTASAGGAHYLSSKCTQEHQPMSFFSGNMWSSLLHQESPPGTPDPVYGIPAS
jgi:hypothetical protein